VEAVIVKNQQQLEDAFFVRKEVFIKEQHVSPEEEMDHLDQESSPSSSSMTEKSRSALAGYGLSTAMANLNESVY
jgi:hypothetical protein